MKSRYCAYDGKHTPLCISIIVFLLALSCLLVFCSFSFAVDKIHLKNVPYVVQKERLD